MEINSCNVGTTMPSKNKENLSAHKWAQTQQNKHYCKCGCGKFIKVTFFHKYEGIPSYINGHARIKYVDLGFGKKTRIFGGILDPKPSQNNRPYYFAHMSFSNKQRKNVHLGTDLNLAKKFVYAYKKATRDELHYTKIVNLFNSIRHKIEKNYTELENAKIDRSLKEAREALGKLRKLIKEKEEAL